MKPTIACMEQQTYVIYSSADDSVIGAKLYMTVLDDNFDNITIYALTGGIAIASLAFFDALEKTCDWGKYAVKYATKRVRNSFVYYIRFSNDEFDYYIEADSHKNMSISQVLSRIYS